MNGAVIATGDAETRASLGAVHATPEHVWLVYGSPSGLHVGRAETDGRWTQDALPQPNPLPHAWWWSALAVSPDESRAWLQWESWDFSHSSPFWTERSGVWDGVTWTTFDETPLFARYAAFGGATSWTPITLDRGVGAFCYGYQDWGTSRQHYHVHTIR